MFPKPFHIPLSFLCFPSPISPFLPSHSLSGPFHTTSPIKSVLPLFHTIYTIPTWKAYQISPLLWLPHIYTSLSIQSTNWHNLIANRNLFLKRNLPFQNERTIPGGIILLIGKLLFFSWITQTPTLQRQQSNTVLKSNQSANTSICTHHNHHILHFVCFVWETFASACSSHAPVGQTAQIHMIPIQWLCDEGPATKIHWLKKYHEIAYHVDSRWKAQEAIVGTTRFGQKAIKHTHALFPFSACFEVKVCCLFVECLFLQGLNEIGDKWVKCNSRSCSILQMGLNQLQPAWPHLFKLVSGRCYSVLTSSSHNDPQLHWSSQLCTDQDKALRDVAMMQIVPLTRAKMMQQCTLCQL